MTGRTIYDGWTTWRCRVVPVRHRWGVVIEDRFLRSGPWRRQGVVRHSWVRWTFASQAEAIAAAESWLDQLAARLAASHEGVVS